MTVPGVEMASVLLPMEVRRSEVSPVSESWNCTATTAMAPSGTCKYDFAYRIDWIQTC